MGELLPRWKLTRDTGKMQFCILGWRARRDPSTLQKKIFPPAFEDGRKSALDFSALAFGPFHSLALTHWVAVAQHFSRHPTQRISAPGTLRRAALPTPAPKPHYGP